MAIITAIPDKTQNRTAMKRVLAYVMQDYKTTYKGVKLVSGQNCIPESAYTEFMATKNQYRKANGVFFKQYVQSFKPGTATPELIHQIGVETAKFFNGFEVVIATHIDRDHWHNHFVVNSVNCETGLKIQINEKGLEDLRNYSDKICRQFGLEILKPYTKPKQTTINTKEYRAAMKGESWKFALMATIDQAMKYCKDKDEFKNYLKRYGYDVKWQENYKYITYICPNNMKCRDIRLHQDKYKKEMMELEFRLRELEMENAEHLTKMEEATSVTIVDRDCRQELIQLLTNQQTLLENTIDKDQMVKLTTYSIHQVETKLKYQTDQIADRISSQQQQAGKLSENISSATKEMSSSIEHFQKAMMKKCLPLMIAIPSAIQILLFLGFMLWQALLK